MNVNKAVKWIWLSLILVIFSCAGVWSMSLNEVRDP